MTTATEPVPLPPGTNSLDGWQDDEQLGTYRKISGKDRWPAGRELVIGTSAVQLADGSVDDGRVEDGPTVWLGGGADHQLTPDAAREVGEALIAAADEVDRWCGTMPTAACEFDAMFADVPLPTGASVTGWGSHPADGPMRFFTFWVGHGDQSSVSVEGEQYLDGRVGSYVSVHIDSTDGEGGEIRLTLPATLELASLLTQAAINNVKREQR